MLKPCCICRGLAEEGESAAKQAASSAKKASRKAGSAVEDSEASDIGSKAQEAADSVQVGYLHISVVQRHAMSTSVLL